MNSLPYIAVSLGEPAGIGPEIGIKLLGHSLPGYPVFFADRAVIQQAMDMLGEDYDLLEWQASGPKLVPGERQLLFHQLDAPRATRPAIPEPDNARYLLKCLEVATRYCLQGKLAALVTGPLNKAVINDAGISFSGHTEFLAEQCEREQVVMMLASRTMRVTLVTTHLPLSQVPKAVTRERLEFTIRTTHHELENRFAIKVPKIQVLGLNPHAGEGGHMGKEEINTITPVINRLRAHGMHLSGPEPADTAFNQETLKRCDAVVAMYHDQGLPVLKHASFGNAVNITLGLPIIRTSVDHGTAFDLAGSGKADESSLKTAFAMACEMARAG